ncbi:hypothetical protein V1J52_10785 [Streptomyces sp. TRM 70351]|uniref:hypothetical protein n=1 Tax=Streptomyces sp. TRM 70351 TaxID=3116552 RepID=UPI002E7AF685|nr:hypothetical protein [Streptomyces sp. TRM 70351]MEE1928675.1 hypothetical protein [Streptomyces sp. TRM 70351]
MSSDTVPADERDESTGPGERPGRARAGRRRLAAVAVAAAVLLTGGGAYWAATGHGPGRPDGGPAVPRDLRPLALDGPARAASAAEQPAPDSGTGSGTGDGYRVAGTLPEGPESAPVFRPAPRADQETVTALARALGIAARPERVNGSWRAADGTDGTGPVLHVAAQGGGAWTFTRYGGHGGTAAGPDAPVSTQAPPPADAPGAPAGGGSRPAQPITPPVPRAQAEEVAAPVLEAVGLAGAGVDAGRTTGALRTVEAAPQVGGLPTHGWETTVTVGADGVLVRAAGMLARPAPGPEYPVVDAPEALRALEEDGAAATVHCVRAPCGTSRRAAPGGTVTGASFGLAAYRSGGTPLLVPAWLFEVDGGTGAHTVAFPAVEPRYLTTTAAGERPGPGDVPAAPPEPGAAEPALSQPGSAEPARPGPAPEGGPARPKGDDLGGLGPGQQPPGLADLSREGLWADAYAAGDRRLTVHLTGGVCHAYAARAEESADRVVISVSQEAVDPGQPCILLAKELALEVTLERPVGARTVVDAAGDRVPVRG